MSKGFSGGEIHIGTGTEQGDAQLANSSPFRILVLGDFTGRGTRVRNDISNALAGGRPIEINRDNFNDVMARLGVNLQVSFGDDEESSVDLRFQSLEHFHPDHLYQTETLFARFRAMRRGLLSQATFDTAAEEVRKWGLVRTHGAEKSPEPEPPPAPPEPPAEPANLDGLLDQTLAQTDQATPRQTRTSGLPPELQELVRRSIEPYRVQSPDPERDELVASVDHAAGQVMSRVLHSPEFQAVEAAWRGLAFLVYRLATGPKLKISLVDVSLDEFAEDFRGSNGLAESGLYRMIVDQTVSTPGADRWSLIVGNYSFGASNVDLLLAACLGRIAKSAGAPFFAGGNPLLVGCNSFAETPDPRDWQADRPKDLAETWEGVKAMSDSTYLALAAPRMLLRMPYGPDSSRVESFPYQEIQNYQDHSAYLWGNSAFGCAYLLGQTFLDEGWKMQPSAPLRISELPLYIHEDVGEEQVLPCGEALLTEAAILQLAEAGLTPLYSIRETGAVQLACWQSVKGPLSGPWQ